MKTPHKYAELIKAWADGAEIQCRNKNAQDTWELMTSSCWDLQFLEFRIKPEPKPDVVHIWYAEPDSYPRFKDYGPYNLKLTFDGETGKLKSAEVL